MTQPWQLTADEILALSLDELALRVLQDADHAREWNWRNWLLGKKRLLVGHQAALQALSEAWGC